jgi:glycosyltransferase involved in cell wall biosynthesis
MAKIVIIGSAYPLRGGGLASFNERMARQFMQEGHDVHIWTFSLQYPNFLFPGTTQYSTEAAPTDLNINVCINSINPVNWLKVGNKLKHLKPDIIVVRYWMPFMAPCLGTILHFVKKNNHTKIICIADNVIPHEKKFYDTAFTKYFVKMPHAFLTMSEHVMQDLRKFTQKPAEQVVHPLYDNFGLAVNTSLAKEHLKLPTHKKTLLFFGFIREYKGLDVLMQALHIIKKRDTDFYDKIQLVVAGEYYENEQKYKTLISDLQLADVVVEHTHFIENDEVKQYFCAADVVIQPYKHATQSGVTPLAYHFEKPMIVTNVGALASNVPQGEVGLVSEPNADAIADAIQHFFELDYAKLVENIKEEKKKYSWASLTNAILNLAKV